jgi:hypothetical protein
LELPYLGDVKRWGISLLPGIWEHGNGGIYMNSQKFSNYGMYKKFWGAIITVSRSVSTVMNGGSDQAFEYDGYGQRETGEPSPCLLLNF